MSNTDISESIKYDENNNSTAPVWFIKVKGTDFRPESLQWQNKVNQKIKEVLKRVDSAVLEEPVLIKCHIGEKDCITRMLPEFCLSTVEFFKDKGFSKIVSGDSTVAYTGSRGHKENKDNCSLYYALAKEHGWTKDGALGVPFVVLDRPKTQVKDVFEFDVEEVEKEVFSPNRFKRVYLAGAVEKAGTIVNHIHLTLHDLAQVAGAVKGLTMGCSSYRGKFIMHKSYHPVINQDTCKRCGLCSLHCPEDALYWERGDIPRLDTSKCIGCGECAAVCPNKSVSMASSEINDWVKGTESLPYRMIDYLMGMMQGKWDRIINVMHLYRITRLCDCVEKKQKPIIEPLGFLIGKNPFAVDFAATQLLNKEIYESIQNGKIKVKEVLPQGNAIKAFFKDFHQFKPYQYLQDNYGVVVRPDLKIVNLD